ncbi:MAG: TIGR01906 family membrane protein [Hespellia sp.]|nr:TIGR01906 family membrane protein [Hespellia sp.]
MKRFQWILGVTASIAFIFVMLITSFEIAAYSDFGWYQKEYEKYNVTRDLTMEIGDVMDVTHEMMSYLRGDRENLVVYTTINKVENQEFFNEQDKIHMADVQNLFLGGLKLRMIALGALVLCLGVLVATRADWKRILPRCYQIGLGIAVAGSVMVGIYAAADFDTFFTKFHEIFFTNDLWIFDPRTDYMIRMLPEEFFADMVSRIGVIFAGGLLLMLAVSILCDKMFRRKGITQM